MSFIDTLKTYSSFDNLQGTDKVTIHAYGDVYASIFEDLKARDEDVKVLEIGIMTGGFLQAVADYVPKAHVYGVDVDLSRLKFGKDHDRIHIFGMDGTTAETAAHLNQTFDVIIEDGSHYPEHQKAHLDVFAPYLKKGGVYVTEDIDQAHADTLKVELQAIADKHGLVMEWKDLRHVTGRFDDIMAIFRTA